jgi:hypothetical protein
VYGAVTIERAIAVTRETTSRQTVACGALWEQIDAMRVDPPKTTDSRPSRFALDFVLTTSVKEGSTVK